MLEITVYNRENKAVEPIKVDEAVLGKEVNRRLLRDVVVAYEAAQRQGDAKTKTRGEVEGSTRKPWKQKHTGRARIGTVRSPIWRHGGIIFGPQPRDYSYQMPKKMLRRALQSALLAKCYDKELFIIEDISLDKPKTKNIAGILKGLGINRSCLIGLKEPNRTITLATRNIPKVEVMPVKDFNAYTVLNHKNILLTKEAWNNLLEWSNKL